MAEDASAAAPPAPPTGNISREDLEKENAELLEKIKGLKDQIKTIKDSTNDKEEIKKIAGELEVLTFQLPEALMSEVELKKYKKMLKKKENAKAQEEKKRLKAERAAKFGGGKGKEKKKKNAKKGGAEEKKEEPFVNKTPPGEKKDMSGEIAKAYNPIAVEASWDAWWEKSGFYKTDVQGAKNATDDEKFVIVIPPPNVTGSLHIGHALTCSIEDALCRWNRMKGKYVMWLPGTDHAGIATQAVVEKKLMKEKKLTRQDLGREKFLEQVWEWKNAKGARILQQLRRLGASVDHSRTVFTLDEKRSKCVTEAFVRMYDDGLIYRDTRLVNWSHALNTALSDVEVDHEKIEGITLRHVKGHDPNKKYEFGTLTSFAYKIADENGNPTDDEVIVATTRLETMLGDTAVAVNPNDPRYKAYQGKMVYHPFRKCTIPIICDEELVDMEFGTGAVKITPAHDPNDFKCGRKHNLEEISILNDNGSINGVCGAPFENMMRFDCRYFIQEELEKLGLFRDKQPHNMEIPICSRSGDVIEPRLVPQWWVACGDMAKEGLEKVHSGELKIVPKDHIKTWDQWLGNIRDWCISRQLWWGHRIPAYRLTKPDKGSEKWFVGRNEEEAKERAAKDLGIPASEITLEQDPDVLDTWFSSGLFPFSTFGWAHDSQEDKDELAAFFPGSLLETGSDILFFWVARMVMMSLQLTKSLPFNTVYLHAMVRDKYGRKMSKSLGNVLDPIQVMEGVTLEQLHETLMSGNLPEKEIEKAKQGQKMDYPDGIPECGADALRFGLLVFTKQASDVNLDIAQVAAYRRFCNKLWQLTKFILMNIGNDFTPTPGFLSQVANHDSSPVAGLAYRDLWLLSRLASTAKTVNEAMEAYDFSTATTTLHRFYLETLCDVYVELVKRVIRLGSAEDATQEAKDSKKCVQNTLWYTLDVALRLMHPFMPFVTEELWQHLPGRPSSAKSSIMISHYPGSTPIAMHKDDQDSIEETKALAALPNEAVDARFESLIGIAKEMRRIAALLGVQSNKSLAYMFKVDSQGTAEQVDVLKNGLDDLSVLGTAKTTSILAAEEPKPFGCAVGVPESNMQIFLRLPDTLNPEEEIARLEASIAKVDIKLQQSLKQKTSSYEKMKPAGRKKIDESIASNQEKINTYQDQLLAFKQLQQ